MRAPAREASTRGVRARRWFGDADIAPAVEYLRAAPDVTIASRDVRALVDRLARDEARSVLLCSHNLVEVQQLCDRIVVLEHGRVIADGAPSVLAAELGIGRLRLDVEPQDVDRAVQVLLADRALRRSRVPEGGWWSAVSQPSTCPRSSPT